MVRFLTFLALLFLLIQVGCIAPSKIKVNLNSKSNVGSGKAAASLSSVSIVNNQIVLSGANLNGVTEVRVSGPSVNETLSIESKSTTDLIANGTVNIAFLLGGVFDLIISDARGAATYQVTFTLPNGSVTAPMLDTMGAVTPGQVLTWNGSDWEAQNAASGTIYLGVWDATTNTPDLSLAGTSSGEYYIVTNETGSYLNGDWMIWDGFVWDHLSMTSVASVFGRGGDVVAQEGDISTINYLGDVNTVGAVSGQVLKYDGSAWIPSTDLNSGGSNLINNGSDAYLTGGYLGVGIESPTYAVHVKSTSGGLSSLIGLESPMSGAGQGSSIDFINSSSAKQAQVMALYESVNNTSLVFSTRNTSDSLQERVRINSLGYLGIGTNNPSSLLTVVGGDAEINTVRVGLGRGGGTTNTVIGVGALDLVTTALDSTAVGYHALDNLTSGDFNTAVGANALRTVTTGAQNVAVGRNSGQAITNGMQNVAIGFNALQYGNSNGDVAIGSAAFSNLSYAGSRNVGVGTLTLGQNTSGTDNTAIGYNSGYSITTGIYNIAIGSNVTVPLATGSYQINIGNTIYGNRTLGYVGLGTTTPTAKLDIAGNIRIADGTEADGYVLTSDSYGHASWQANTNSQWITNASDIYYSTGKVGIGTSTPTAPLSIGDGVSADGGIVALGYGTVGTDGNALSVSGAGTRMFWYPKKAAFRAGWTDNTSWDDANIGNYSVAMGGRTKASGGFGATAFGWYSEATGQSSFAAGNSPIASGSGSIVLGSDSYSTGANTTALGLRVRADGNYSMAFSAGAHSSHARVTGANSVGFFLGDQGGTNITSSNVMSILGGNVGIGTISPTATLHVSGNLRLTAGAGADLYLKSDADGYASWAAAPTASNIVSSTTGYIAATNVNSAIAELESEKLSLSGDTIMSGIFDFSGVSILRTNQVPVMLTDVTNVQYVQDYVANNGPWIDNVTTVYNIGATVGVGTDSPAAKLDVSGEVKISETGLACSATTKGSIRYNNTSNVLEFCNGTGWNLVQAAACSDATPNVISFTDEANATATTLYNSNILEVTGINCSVPVTISGTGSPQFRICSDNTCATVLQDWTTSPSNITTNQYLQTRLTSDTPPGAKRQATIIVGSAATVWSVTVAGGDCTGSPTVGTVCADGTVYAGITPDGSVKMYTTRCDLGQTWDGANCTGVRQSYSWNDGSTDYIITGYQNTITGQYNSAGLAASVDIGSPYFAAIACENLVSDGYSDWYLPASGEALLLSTGRNAIGNLNLGTAYYATSTEAPGGSATTGAYELRVATEVLNIVTKSFIKLVRCVRR